MSSKYQRYYRTHCKQRLLYSQINYHRNRDRYRQQAKKKWQNVISDPQLYSEQKERNRVATQKYRQRHRAEIRARINLLHRIQRKKLALLKEQDPTEWAKQIKKEKDYRKKYSELNKERLRSYSRAYYHKKRFSDPAWKKRRESHQLIYRRKHRDKLNAWHRKRYQEIRKMVFDHYGNSCACCGESTFQFLGMDHMDTPGRQHRRESASLRRASNLYHWLKKQGFPSGFQTLCHNCNQAKGIYGECPHVKLSVVY